MKKTLSIFVAFVLIMIMSPVAFAAGPVDPQNVSTGPDCDVDVGDEVMLWCDASVDDGGTLTYLWYISYTPNMMDIRLLLVEDEPVTTPTFTFSQDFPGVAYYCCGVWNNKDGVESNPVYTRLVKVEFREKIAKPEEAYLKNQPKDQNAYVNEKIELYVDAMSPDGGILSYRWLAGDTDNVSQMYNLPGETSEALYLNFSTPTKMYYACEITNTKNGVAAIPTYTYPILVQVSYPPKAAPQKPVVSKQPSEASATVGESVAISCDATSPDGGSLSYLWYRSDTPNIQDIRAINATSKELKITETAPGVAYYCCGIWNTLDGEESEPTYTNLVKVEFKEKQGAGNTGNNGNTTTTGTTGNNGSDNTNNTDKNDANNQKKLPLAAIMAGAAVLIGLLVTLLIILLGKKKKKDAAPTEELAKTSETNTEAVSAEKEDEAPAEKPAKTSETKTVDASEEINNIYE